MRDSITIKIEVYRETTVSIPEVERTLYLTIPMPRYQERPIEDAVKDLFVVLLEKERDELNVVVVD